MKKIEEKDYIENNKIVNIVNEIKEYYSFYGVYSYLDKYYISCGTGLGYELIPLDSSEENYSVNFEEINNSNDEFELFKEKILQRIVEKKDKQIKEFEELDKYDVLSLYKGKEYFEAETAMKILLGEGILILNSNWWEKDWPEKAQKSFSVGVNCSDTFYYASADAETLYYKDLKCLYKEWIIDEKYGHIIWCIKKRNMMPLKEVYERIQKDGKFNLDEIKIKYKLRDNPSCKY
jgi:hypothetical protein